MTGPVDPPRWRALEIGPGGVPPSQVRPWGPDAPVISATAEPAAVGSVGSSGSAGPAGPQLNTLPPLWRHWADSAPVDEPPRPGPSRTVVVRIVWGVVVLALVAGLAWWANNTHPLGGSGGASSVAVGECVSSSGQRIVAEVDCGSAAADFTVVGRYPDASDGSSCSASPSDVAVILSGSTVLCLDYVATVGDCLLAGTQATQVGKVDCDSTLPGVYRVLAVVRNSIDPADCPATTSRTLIHRHNSEVICLARG